MSEFAARIGRVKKKGGADVRIVPLRDVSAKDIVSQFRRMADEIEAGEHGYIESMVACAEVEGEVQLFGWGNCDLLRSLGLFTAAQHELARIITEKE